MKKQQLTPFLAVAMILLTSASVRADAVTDWHTFKAAPATTLSGQGTSSPVFGSTSATASQGFLLGYLNTPLSLVNVGDKITFSYSMSFNDATGMTAQSADNFRFALYDVNGEAQVSSDNTATAGTTDTDNIRGYWFGVKSGTGAQGSMRKRTGTSGDQNLFANASGSLLGTAGGTAITYSGAVNGVGGTTYAGELTLTKTASGVDLSGFFAGNGGSNTFAFSDTTSPFTSNFGAVAFLDGGGISADQLIFQSVSVSLIPVPEPAAMGLGILGASVFFLRRIWLWKKRETGAGKESSRVFAKAGLIALAGLCGPGLRADPVTNWHTFRNGATTLTGQGTSSPTLGDTANSSSTAFMIGYLTSPLSLTNVGDKITLTFDVSFNDAIGMSPAGADNFRFALYDLNGGAAATDDNTATAGTADTMLYRGYWLGVKAGSGAAGSMRKRTGTTTDQNVFANASAGLLGTASGPSIVYVGATNGVGGGVIYSGSMVLELQSDGVALSGFFTGNGATNTFSFLDTTTPFSNNFSAVGYLNGNAISADQVLFTNVTVTLTHPLTPVTLSIVASGNNVIVAWPLSGIGFNLQAAENLAAPVTWTNVPNSNTTNSMTLPAAASATYFRLSN